MAQCLYKMALDVAERDTLISIVARQGDSDTRFLRVGLFSLGEPLRIEEGATVMLNTKSAAGELMAFSGSVNSDGSITLPMPARILKNTGTVTCDVSIITATGGRLTTPSFEVEVVASLADGDLLPGDDSEGSITAEMLAKEKVFPLIPEKTSTGFVVAPLCNRKHTLDLSSSEYSGEEGWHEIALSLPTPADPDDDSWILIYCHAPLHEAANLTINWGDASTILFADGIIPEITRGDFDIICTYSRVAAKWQIGVVQYEMAGGDA